MELRDGRCLNCFNNFEHCCRDILELVAADNGLRN